MNMKQVEKSWFSWLLASLMVVMMFLSMAKPVTSQSTDRNSTMLLLNRVHYAVARTLINGEAVWGLASCRGYVSTTNCVACFDHAVVLLRACGRGSGAHAFYNDCDLRYENYNFYADANNPGGIEICGNTKSPQQTEFKKTVEGLISDLRTATPRTSDFYAVSTRALPDRSGTVYGIAQCNLNLSQSVCEDCLNSRYSSLDDCLPSTNGWAFNNGCFMRYSNTPFFGLNQTTNITPLLWDGNSNKKRSIIGGVFGGVCFLLLVIAFVVRRLRSKKTSGLQQDKSTGSTELLQGPARYSYNDLKVATENFSDECKIGGGVFGEVYKGILKDGGFVAIKKTVMSSTRGKIHFNDQLKIISNVHHRHLIRLLGYCSKGPLLFLVHEFMNNGSLDQFLYGDKSRNLSWRQRLLPEDKTHLSTKLAASLDSGYVAPEYAIHGQLSEKVDTYSFGIVVLEIISGKRCHDVIDDKSVNQSLLDHAWNLYESGTHVNLIDNRLDASEYAAEDVMKIIEIALMCTQSQVSARPAMSEVVTLLSDKSLDEIPPIRSTFHENDIKIPIDTSISLSSNAAASTVQVSGR
ncbi:unnamed protein product [Lactuca virosa]|uniref:Cysteine-rich receptor-like protein kinase 2 n=1 Tax=Lactuca virosa TaxID=75947 RepID=A0AAU9MTL9_9ASTR|nr:unnamed protein product [Lactuca virosa]